jgi:hypothetical protein
MSLLAISSDSKTVKGQKFGYMTGILYLAPFTLSGVNLCPMAEKAKCFESCLNTAGRGVMNSVQKGRLRKAALFNNDQQAFMMQLVKDIRALIRKANREGFTPLVRLNGTSDIRWENVTFVDMDNRSYGKFGHKKITIFQLFPRLQFYDYTKISNRKNIPDNYDLTYSYSGVEGYKRYVSIAIANYMRVAVVFRDRKRIPATFLDMECIDGDDSDLRHLDPPSVVVALYAKGRAKKDNSGFVVN